MYKCDLKQEKEMHVGFEKKIELEHLHSCSWFSTFELQKKRSDLIQLEKICFENVRNVRNHNMTQTPKRFESNLDYRKKNPDSCKTSSLVLFW